jgi:hypothetical protein
MSSARGRAQEGEKAMSRATRFADGAPPPLPDPLHIADRIQPAPGERVIGSRSIATRRVAWC